MADQEDNKNVKQLMIATTDNNKANEENKKIESKEEKNSDDKQTESPKRFGLGHYQSSKEKEMFKRLTIIVSILSIGILITLYFISPFSKVGKIIVSGVQKSDGTAIVEASKLKVNKSLWEQYFKRAEASDDIVKQNPRVESAKIQLKNLNTLQINVKEYKTIGYVEKDNKSYEILSNGKFLEQKNSEKNAELPLLINFEEGENLTEFIKAYQEIPDAVKEKIDNIESLATKTNPFRIQFKMKDGNEVIGLSTTIADKMAFYDKIAAEMKTIGVIDMEAGTSGVFSYPFKTEETSATENTAEVE